MLNFKLYNHEVISWPYTATEFSFILVWSTNTVTEPVDSVAIYNDGNRLLLQRTVGNFSMKTTPHGKINKKQNSSEMESVLKFIKDTVLISGMACGNVMLIL